MTKWEGAALFIGASLCVAFLIGVLSALWRWLLEWHMTRHERARRKGIDVVPVYPAVAMRNHDWCATRKSYEPGDIQGWGATPEEAIENLHAQEHAR